MKTNNDITELQSMLDRYEYDERYLRNYQILIDVILDQQFIFNLFERLSWKKLYLYGDKRLIQLLNLVVNKEIYLLDLSSQINSTFDENLPVLIMGLTKCEKSLKEKFNNLDNIFYFSELIVEEKCYIYGLDYQFNHQ